MKLPAKTVRCNNCMKEFWEEELVILEDGKCDNGETNWFKGCPNCKTDAYLTDEWMEVK